MLKLDAPRRGFEVRAISDHDYPESECGDSGPGWSWMWVSTPFNSQYVRGQFTDRVFKRCRTSHKDMEAFVRENLGDSHRHWSTAAAAVIRGATAQEFVLVCSSDWAIASYEVRSGRSAEAGTAFYNGWVGAMNVDPRRAFAVMGSQEPVLMPWA
ncbi:hypothetical protein [Streptomyces sp. NPDC048428]|uniref:hypothetical protein n=1 Tax=Streptomyces sp. NPDC048428 TaxID=3154503 RepID=UPI0034296CE2